MLLACVEYVAVHLRGVTITGAGFSFVSNFEVVSVVFNRGMTSEAMDHLSGEG